MDSISVLVSRNDDLDDTEWYTWFEKRYNEIVLDMMSGTEPDSAALADLRTMAQSCFADGGRAVMSARGLCEVLLKEYYDEDSCDPITEERSTDFGYPVTSLGFKLSPNPASHIVRVQLLNRPANNNGYSIGILTTGGQSVYNGIIPKGEMETTIPLAALHNGMYLVHVRNGKEEFTQPLLIQK